MSKKVGSSIEVDILQALVQTIEIKDLCTASHTWRVTLYTRAVAERRGVEPEVLERLSIAASLHDIGKIEIPDEILQKPGRLTAAEFEIMKSHTLLGHDRLVRMGEDDELMLAVVRSHHERMDGLGYPDGLKGDQIHYAARLFAVVDTFDAMTSVRPYHEAFGRQAAAAAISQLRSEAGTHFCAEYVETLAECFARGELDWILMNFNDRVAMPETLSGLAERELSQRFRDDAA